MFMHNSVCVFVSHILYILCLRLCQSIHTAIVMSVFARTHKNKGYGELVSESLSTQLSTYFSMFMHMRESVCLLVCSAT